jgi:hypothetical protein
MSISINWDAPPLDAIDQRLVQAYEQARKSLDDLAYTPQFLDVVREAGYNPDRMSDCHFVYRRLLTLRKQGRLPRAYALS